MYKKSVLVKFLTGVFIFFGLAVPASLGTQESDKHAKCSGSVYKPKEVSPKARITSRAKIEIPGKAYAEHVSGRIVLRAVLCSSGQVTDIDVVKSLPYGLTERAIEAARKTKFTPAEKEGRPVSQTIQFEYQIHLN